MAFPTSPTTGTTYFAPNGIAYVFDAGGFWRQDAASAADVLSGVSGKFVDAAVLDAALSTAIASIEVVVVTGASGEALSTITTTTSTLSALAPSLTAITVNNAFGAPVASLNAVTSTLDNAANAFGVAVGVI